ncbi:hypothetical protein ABIB15_002540 [Marisediminicola sp. UYEF4]|uniref:hypothetical protein n=1 Tax=Marisediminicola sp. UYEF4 TaxID=1756384 RepID=UPI00339AC04F
MTYGRDLARTALFEAVNPANGATAMVQLAPFVTAEVREVFRAFATSDDPGEFRALFEFNSPNFGAECLTTAQLRSLVLDWEAASAALSEDDAQLLRVLFFDDEGELRAELRERGIEMPYCDFEIYLAAVGAQLIGVGRFSHDEVDSTTYRFLRLIHARYAAREPSMWPAMKILRILLREGSLVI